MFMPAGGLGKTLLNRPASAGWMILRKKAHIYKMMISRYPLLACGLLTSLLMAACSTGSTHPRDADATGAVADTTPVPARPAKQDSVRLTDTGTVAVFTDTIPPEGLDTADYNQRVRRLANHDHTGRWPAKAAYPLPGALLPYHRIVAYYGNFYSKRMGVLGEYPATQMLNMLREEARGWAAADSLTPVMPAIHYIAVTAQGSPGEGSKYRLRMPEKEIRKALALGDSIRGIVFLDIQVGQSNLQEELPLLEKYLALPNVHLAIDPEFSMKSGKTPGSVIGTMDAADINYAADRLAELVRTLQLPPKVLVVHRFTAGMVTNYRQIRTRPEVQIVMDMDGFGAPPLKRNSYTQYIFREPVQFTGLKLFYKNDRNKTRMMTHAEILKLTPAPVYIQYQ